MITKLKFDYLILIIIFTTGAVGVFTYNTFNILPSKYIFLFMLILIIIYSFLKKLQIDRRSFIYLTISIIYIIYSFIYLFMNNIVFSIIDFFQAYNSFVYIIFLSLLFRKKIITQETIRKIFYIIILLSIIKYAYTLYFGYMHRPGIFTENNYELMFLLLLYTAKQHNENKINYLDLGLLAFLIVISGSRSAILSLAAVFFFLDFGKRNYVKVFKFVLLILVLILVYYVLRTRMDGMTIEDIDRVKFLFVFIDEIKKFDITNFLIGLPPLTPLQDYNCEKLSFYKNLFSHTDSGICFSVILHSYILRVILDHGFLGLVFIFSFVFYILKYSGYKANEILAVLSILFINGLSVSSFNSSFAILGLVFLISQKEKIAKFKIIFTR